MFVRLAWLSLIAMVVAVTMASPKTAAASAANLPKSLQGVHTICLGTRRSEKLFVISDTRKVDPTWAGTGVRSLRLSFFTKKGTRFCPGFITGYPETFVLHIADFEHVGHNQVFIKSQIRGYYSYVYDFDGTSVHTIYGQTGDIFALPVWRRRQWELAEYWAVWNYVQTPCLGVSHYSIKDHAAIRYLHWNGSEFVPDRPGVTMIIGD